MALETDEPPLRSLPAPPKQPDPTNEHDGQIAVACVLRSSKHYNAGEVNRLFRGVSKHLERDFRFVCLTDEREGFDRGVEIIPLKHPNWITKQSKMELFRPDLDLGRTLYIDLDTIVCGSLESIASYDGKFCLLDDLAGGYQVNRGTGLILWDGEFGQDMYRDFVSLPETVRNDVYRVDGGRSDQLYINHHMMLEPHRFQWLWPGQIVSYKCDVRKNNSVPNDARLICFHGNIKPCEVEHFRAQFD